MRKKQGSKKKWIVIVCIAIILFAAAGSVLWMKFKEKSEELQKVTSISVKADDTYPAGENMGKITVTAEGLDAAGNHVVQQLEADQYVVTPERIPEHGHDFEITVTLREDEEVQAKITALIERQEVQRYEIGRKDPEAVQAILYENGDLEIAGSGTVKNYRENEMPWKEDGVLYLSWIDPETEIESMDYWFSGNSEFVAMLCSIPDTVRSMVRTFYGCTSMESVPDMTTAVYLEDITACYNGSAVRNGGELPGNLRSAEEAYRNCTALIHAADASACVQLTNMKNCYNGCNALADTSTPDSVTNLEGAYQNCLNVTRVSIPSKVENLTAAYSGCTALTTIDGEVPASCTSMSGAFKNCKFLSGNLTIHCATKSITGIFSGAAQNSNGLTVSLSWEGKTAAYQAPEEILATLVESIETQAKTDGSNIRVKSI